MSKYDLVLKINPLDLITELKNEDIKLPHELLQRKLEIKSQWKANYFSWGRNGLYYLFKNLSYKKITFPAFTCPTLVEAAEKAGKIVVLTEIDLETFNLDIDKISNDTQCLFVVHTFGNPINILKIRKKISKNVFVIEDCAHGLFSRIGEKFVGTQGNIIFFSLYKQIPNINGALILAKEKLFDYQPIEGILKHGKRILIKTEGWHQRGLDLLKPSYLPKIQKQKITNFQPNRLVNFLFNKGFFRLEKEVQLRNRVAKWYDQIFKNSNFFIPQRIEKDNTSSYYQFAIRLKPEFRHLREKIVFNLRKKGIFADRLWYQAPITQKKYHSYQEQCPNALLLAKTIINLPIYSWYTKEDIKFLFNKLNIVIKSQ